MGRLVIVSFHDNLIQGISMPRRFVSILLPLILAPGLAFAQDGGWRGERFNMVVRDQSVRDVLVQFGALAGVPVVLSEGIDSRITARFEDATGEQIVGAIAREYALDWRYDGRRIEFSSNSEQVSRILDMGGVSRAGLVRALEALGTHEPRFPITAIDGQLALLVGPPRYIAIVEVVLAELAEARIAEDAREAERLAKQEIREREEAERAERLAEQLRAEERERLRALLARQRNPVRTGPLINRGGRWGG